MSPEDYARTGAHRPTPAEATAAAEGDTGRHPLEAEIDRLRSELASERAQVGALTEACSAAMEALATAVAEERAACALEIDRERVSSLRYGIAAAIRARGGR